MTNKSKKLRNTKMSKKTRKTGGAFNLRLGDSATLAKNFINNNLINTNDGELRKAQINKETGDYQRDKKGNIVVELESDTRALTKIAKSDLVKEITSQLNSAYSSSSAAIGPGADGDGLFGTNYSSLPPKEFQKKKEDITRLSDKVKAIYEKLPIETKATNPSYDFFGNPKIKKYHAIDIKNGYLAHKSPKKAIEKNDNIIRKHITGSINATSEKDIVGKVLNELMDKRFNGLDYMNSFDPNLGNDGEGTRIKIPIKLLPEERELIYERYVTNYDEKPVTVINDTNGGGKSKKLRKSSKTRRKSNKKRSRK